MNKHEGKRLLAVILALVLTLGLLPANVFAASPLSVLNGQITVDYAGKNAKASVENDVVTAEAYDTVTSGCSGDSFEANTTTLTITNTSNAAATMLFDYVPNLNGGSMTVNGVAVTASGTFSGMIDVNGSVTIEIRSPGGKKEPAVVVLRNFALVGDNEFSVTFTAPENGSMTVNGKAVTTDTLVSSTYANGISVTATPAEGYDFVGWVDANGTLVLKDSTGTIKPSKDMTVRPWFVPAGTAMFGVENQIFDNLNNAAAAALTKTDRKVVLLNNGTVFAGEYTIPAGVTLLIPFDDFGTCYRANPEAVNTVPNGQKVFRKLTVAPNANIIVNGELSVSSKYATAAGGRPMGVLGSYGQIELAEGSAITVNQGGLLYAWGYITGSGHVTAKSGATVYELFQLTDFRGGSASMTCLDTNKKHFVFDQYYVQNIEAPITYETGANEFVNAAVTAGGKNVALTPKFIGDGGLFELTSGTLTKWYDSQLDQLQVAVDGVASLNSISVSFAGVNANSADYNLPINNVMIHIRNGEMTNGQDVEFLPDSGLKVYSGASLNVTAPGEIYLIDAADWGNFVWSNGDKKLAPLVYSPTRGANKRTGDTMKSAVLDVNGTVNVDGILKTSVSGADVISTDGTGIINFNSADQVSHVWHYNQKPSTWSEIPVVSAKLKNVDGTFVETANHTAGTNYQYQQGMWVDPEAAPAYVITWKNEDGTVLETDTNVLEGALPTYDGAEPVKAEDAQNTYKFAGWTPEIVPATGDATYTATFTAVPKTATITWKNEDGTILETDIHVPYGAKPSYDGEVPVKSGDAQYSYTFAGWTPTVEAVTGDATYTAIFTQTENVYTVTWVNWDDTVLEVDEGVPYGSVPTYDGTKPTRAGDAEFTYTFAGWDIRAETKALTGADHLEPVTANITYKATYTAKHNVYTITWMDEDGQTVLATAQVEYGSIPTYDGIPTKAGDAQYRYTFAGWTPEVVSVTGDATYTATFVPEINNYTVTWKNWDGTVLETDENMPYGTTPTYDGVEPSRVGDAQYRYSFNGWNIEVAPVTGDITYTAVFQKTVNTYIITWTDENGEILETDTDVSYGATPGFNGTQPSKAADAQYTYTFAGWTPEVVPVTGDATYTATYTKTVNAYVVTWVDTDGTVLEVDEAVAYGTLPTYDGTEPSKVADAQYSYTFAGWTPEVVPVTGNITYKAVYYNAVRCYTVTWYDEDGKTVLATDTVEYGTVPAYTGEQPTKQGDELNSYEFSGWTPELTAVTGNTSYKAVFTAKPIMHKVVWKDEDGTVLAQGEFAAGSVPAYDGELPTKQGDAQYSYTFKEWKQETDTLTGDMTCTAVYESTLNKYVITFQDEAGNSLDSHEVAYGQLPTFDAAEPVKESEDPFFTYKFVGWTPEIETVTGNATYTAIFEKIGVNGWISDQIGTTYLENGVQIYKDTWADIEANTYFFDTNGYVVKGLHHTTAQDGSHTATFVFDTETGIFQKNQSGLYNIETDTYWTQNGEIIEHAGLVKVGDVYYYFESDNRAVKSETAEPAPHYVEKNNDLALPQCMYQFDQNGVIVHDENTSLQGIQKASDDQQLYLFVDGVKICWGLFELNGDYYYARTSSGAIVRDTTYWVSQTNGLPVEEGSYQFDPDGKMILPDHSKDGIVSENGSLWYYENGKLTYAGLIQIDGNYYYVRSNGEVVHDRVYWTTKTNGLLPEDVYEFGSDGKMIVKEPEPVKNGIVAENGSLWYYVDSQLTYAGLIQIDGNYYYVRSNGEVVHGREYWITNTNGLLTEGCYRFDETGKMMNPPVDPDPVPEMKNGIVSENGSLYYYENGTLAPVGLVKIGNNYYYARTSNAEIIHDRSYWVTRTNGLLPEGLYHFDSTGAMIP